MLDASANFTATELRFLQNEAEEWIKHANCLIIKAAENGLNKVDIRITSDSGIGYSYYNAPLALIEHFKSRGFGHEWGGQSFCTFTW